jgi:hypothetical protein
MTSPLPFSTVIRTNFAGHHPKGWAPFHVHNRARRDGVTAPSPRLGGAAVVVAVSAGPGRAKKRKHAAGADAGAIEGVS